jgi:hypothetical protein
VSFDANECRGHLDVKILLRYKYCSKVHIYAY